MTSLMNDLAAIFMLHSLHISWNVDSIELEYGPKETCRVEKERKTLSNVCYKCQCSPYVWENAPVAGLIALTAQQFYTALKPCERTTARLSQLPTTHSLITGDHALGSSERCFSWLILFWRLKSTSYLPVTSDTHENLSRDLHTPSCRWRLSPVSMLSWLMWFC
jgi:hypothetical protein